MDYQTTIQNYAKVVVRQICGYKACVNAILSKFEISREQIARDLIAEILSIDPTFELK